MCAGREGPAQEGLVRKEIRETSAMEMFRASWDERGPEKLTNIENRNELEFIHLSIRPSSPSIHSSHPAI